MINPKYKDHLLVQLTPSHLKQLLMEEGKRGSSGLISKVQREPLLLSHEYVSYKVALVHLQRAAVLFDVVQKETVLHSLLWAALGVGEPCLSERVESLHCG